MKIKITTDSCCDLSVERLQELNIPYIPLIVILKDEEYQDTINIHPTDIFEFVKKTGTLPKTAAPSIETLKSFFLKELEDDCEIIHIGIGMKLSSTSVHAEAAAKEIGNDRVRVIDSKSLSSGIALLVLYAYELAKEGKLSAKEIAQLVASRVEKVQASFVVETLEYLYRGGRCSMIAALGANLLRLKPRLQLIDGKIVSDERYRGKIHTVYYKYIDDTLKKFDNPDKKRCFVTHSHADPEHVKDVIEYVKSKNIFDEILECTAGATITSHCGRGTLGLLYINDGGTR